MLATGSHVLCVVGSGERLMEGPDRPAIPGQQFALALCLVMYVIRHSAVSSDVYAAGGTDGSQ